MSRSVRQIRSGRRPNEKWPSFSSSICGTNISPAKSYASPRGRRPTNLEKLKWYSIVRPFDRIVPLRERIGTLETLVMPLANVIARADGALVEKEAAAVQSIRDELRLHLRPVPIDEPTRHEETAP